MQELTEGELFDNASCEHENSQHHFSILYLFYTSVKQKSFAIPKYGTVENHRPRRLSGTDRSVFYTSRTV